METSKTTTTTEFNALSQREAPKTHGRDLLLDDVVDLLQRRPIVTLCGPAGVGKSHLAAAATAGIDRVRWLDATRTSVQRLVTETARLTDELLDVHVLVVDGFDGASGERQTDVELLGELVYRLPGLGILVTSRQAIGVAGEQLVRVGPLPLPGRSSLAPLASTGEDGPAVDLLVERATAIDRRFDLSAEDDGLVRELLHRTGGYPSAIAALADRLAVTPARLLMADDAPLVNPIRAIADLEPSLTGIESGAKRTLELLAAASAPVTSETLGAAGAQPADLQPLLERSLIELRRFAGGTTTYALPPTTAAALGHPSPIATAAIDAALGTRADELATRLGTVDESTALNELAVEIEAFELAIERRLAADDVEAAATLAGAVAPAWASACRPGPARRLLAELALRSGELEPATAAATDLWAAVLDVRYGRPADERDLDALADRLNRATADTADEATAFLALSTLTELQTRRPDRALQATATAAATRAAAEASGDLRRQAEAAFATALVRRTAGDSDGATAAVIEASRLAARSGHERIALRCELLLCEHRTGPGRAGLVATLSDLRSRTDRIADRRCRLLVDLAEVIDIAHAANGEAERRLISLIDEVHADADHVLGRLMTFAAAVLCAARGDADTTATLVHALPCPDEAASLIPRPLAETYLELCWKAERSLGRSARTAAAVSAEHLDEVAALTLARRSLVRLAAQASAEPAIDPAPATTAATIEPPIDALTSREADVLRLMAEGLSNKDIARELGVAAKTVMHHAGAIYRKLRVSGRGEAAAAVLQGRVELGSSTRSA